MQSLYPLHFAPVYKDYLWGGMKILRHFGRDGKPGVYAESWEISDRPEGMSVVSNGPLAGQSLGQLVRTYGEALLGRGRSPDRFPLLVKLIDAKETLSVQVHPNDATAVQHGGEPKTEMWYILQADVGAHVFSGLRPGADPAAVRKAIERGTLEDLVLKQPVKAGDIVFMPGGRVHAIGAGCLMLEIQQNSNTTYRLYDWGRVGADGRPRELHVEQGLRVINWNGDGPMSLATCPYFRFEARDLADRQVLAQDGSSFRIGFVASGCVRVGDMIAPAGTSFLIPASVDSVTVTPIEPSRLCLAWQP